MILVQANQLGNQHVFQICDLGVVPFRDRFLSGRPFPVSGLAPAPAHQHGNGNAGVGLALGLVNAGVEPLAA